MSTVSTVLAVAAGEVHTLESGWNQTKYWADLDPGMQGQAWCAAFVSWCFEKAGMPLGHIDVPYGYVNCDNGVNHFRAVGAFHAQPQPGDIAFYWNNRREWAAHTGIVETVGSDGRFVAIEGNTGSEDGSFEGDGVFRRPRTVWECVGFGRPDYGEEETMKGDERDALLLVKALVADIHTAMSEEKVGSFPQPRLDRIEHALAKLSADVTALAQRVDAQDAVSHPAAA